MDLLSPFIDSLPLLLRFDVWLLITAGYIVGVIIGGLPGMGPTLAYGLTLPFTFLMDPVVAVAFLLSISVAAMYGNSIPAIVMGVPGSTAAVMTAIDGYALHRQGRSGLALAIQLVGAIVGQFFSIFIFVLFVVPLARLAYYFLAPEMFAIYMIGLMAVVSLTGKTLTKGFISAGIGLAVGVVGFDPVIGSVERFDFGVYSLQTGLPIAPVLIGLLAISELFRQSRQVFGWGGSDTTFDASFPPFSTFRKLWKSLSTGTIIGTLVGAIPGAGGTPAALISYQQAQMWSKTPEQFGYGSEEGIAANEAAQNASNAGELIPTLGFGIPGSGSMALLLGALTLQGFAPGPRLIENNPEMMSAAIIGMLGGTILMVVTGWWLCKVLLKAATINRSAVIVLALATIMIGIYSLQYRVIDVVITVVFGIIGYIMLRYGYPPAAAALTAVLSRDIERNFRLGLNIADNSVVEFLTRPYTAMILVLALSIAVWGLKQQRKANRPVDPEILESLNK